MIKTGLVSISFRSLSCEEIIDLTKKCGLDGIEWGGDIHVPPDNHENAKKVAELTQAAGLRTSAYGSYYKAGTYGNDFKNEFRKILDTAIILKAPIIRIWAGKTASAEITEEKRAEITKECIEIAKMADEKSIKVAFECHRNTLTDDYNSSLRLMQETNCNNLLMYWQPNESKNRDYNITALKKLMPFITNVHVFNWPDVNCRKPLSDAEKEWTDYLSIIDSDDKEHWCSLEFVPDNQPETLIEEAKTLKKLILICNNVR